MSDCFWFPTEVDARRFAGSCRYREIAVHQDFDRVWIHPGDISEVIAALAKKHGGQPD
jgi:hypothetical protein